MKSVHHWRNSILKIKVLLLLIKLWALGLLSVILIWLFSQKYPSEFIPRAKNNSLVDFQHIIFKEELNSKIKQDDPRLIQYALANHLFPPKPVPYHLRFSHGDPGRAEGQHYVILDLLGNKSHGIFVEAGANDGEYLSTTLALERDLGWTGLLIEPDKERFGKLRKKGRKSWLSNVCLSIKPVPMQVAFVHHKSGRGRHKITNTTDISQVENTWQKSDKELSIVKCLPLFSLLSALNITTIDYLSLDVEGAELAVLKTIPFEKILIRTITVEYLHVRDIPGADKELKKILKSNGFRLVKEYNKHWTHDYIYVHKSVITNRNNSTHNLRSNVNKPK